MANPFDQFDGESSNPFDQFDKQESKEWTGVRSSFANVGNMADTTLSTLAGGTAALFGDDKAAIEIDEKMRERNKSREQWANPTGRDLSGMEKLSGVLATLPMQIAGAGLSPADT